MDLKKLEFFCVVAEEKSLSKAGEKLNYSQSNLSTTIRKLEEEMDAQLFIRSSQGMSLTQKGKELYEYASRMLNMSDRITRAMKEDEESGSIEVGSLESVALTILPEILAEYNRTHPHNAVSVEIGPSFGPNGLVERVKSYHCDLAFISGELEDEELVRCPIGTDHTVFVSNRDYGDDFSYRELLDNQVLRFPMGCVCRMVYDRFAASIGVQPREILEAESPSTIFANVAAGMGVACFPKSCLRFYRTRFPIYVYPVPEEFSVMEWSIIYRRDSYLTRAMKDLIRQARNGGPYIDGDSVS